MVFSQFKIPANLAQLAVPKMQHCPCYMAWKTKIHTWCRHCHLCINAPMWREKRWLQGLFDPPSYVWTARSIEKWNLIRILHHPHKLTLLFRFNDMPTVSSGSRFCVSWLQTNGKIINSMHVWRKNKYRTNYADMNPTIQFRNASCHELVPCKLRLKSIYLV